jgi:hypothetical protein
VPNGRARERRTIALLQDATADPGHQLAAGEVRCTLAVGAGGQHREVSRHIAGAHDPLDAPQEELHTFVVLRARRRGCAHGQRQ